MMLKPPFFQRICSKSHAKTIPSQEQTALCAQLRARAVREKNPPWWSWQGGARRKAQKMARDGLSIDIDKYCYSSNY